MSTPGASTRAGGAPATIQASILRLAEVGEVDADHVLRNIDVQEDDIVIIDEPDGPIRPGWTSYSRKFSNVTTGSGGLSEASYIFAARIFTPPEWETPFREWLHQEHFIIQMETPGLRWCHSYEPLDGPFHFFNLWGMDEPDVPNSEAWLEIRNTPWFSRIEPAFAVSHPRRGTYAPDPR